MKAGILTFHEANNYGAVLQAYALQQTLKKMKTESELLTVHAEQPAENAPQPATSSLYARRIQEADTKRARLFDAFRQQHLVCSAACTKDSLESLNKKYDFFLAGSDQIWNTRIPDAGPLYFLPFADQRKCFSYAASFGSEELPAAVKDWCAQQLARFTLLSVREESGRRLVRELIQRDAAVCLDPTLLLDRCEWERLISPVSGRPYYFLYILKYDELLVDKARKAASQAGFELKVITGGFIPQFGFSAWNESGVTDWLSLLAGSEGVFTNSFHGTAFSLIFEKPLYVHLPGGELGKRNGRIEELLKKAGLTEVTEDSLSRMPVGSAVKALSRVRDESMHYLQNVIDCARQML